MRGASSGEEGSSGASGAALPASAWRMPAVSMQLGQSSKPVSSARVVVDEFEPEPKLDELEWEYEPNGSVGKGRGGRGLFAAVR